MFEDILRFIGFFLVLSPFVLSVKIATSHSRSRFSLWNFYAGVIAGTVSVTYLGFYTLLVFKRDWWRGSEGFGVFMALALPIIVYVGAVAGAFLVAILYIYNYYRRLSTAFVAMTAALACAQGVIISYMLFKYEFLHGVQSLIVLSTILLANIVSSVLSIFVSHCVFCFFKLIFR